MYSDRPSPIQSEAYEQDMVPVLFPRWVASPVVQAALQPGERVLDAAGGTGVGARLSGFSGGGAGLRHWP